MNNAVQVNKQHFRADLPFLEIGDKVEVITKHLLKDKKEKEKYRLTHFKGIVVAQKNKQKISHSFSVLEETEKIVIRSVFSYHSPFIVEIKKLGKIKQKIRQAKLYQLEREIVEKKS